MVHNIKNNDNGPRLLHIEPVLPVTNIQETIAYWHETLGFPDKWTWGNPPNHGGVSWQGAGFIQFSFDPKRNVDSAGHFIWINVRNIKPLYSLHLKNARIVSPLENKPWGFSEYTINDINGHYV